MRNIVLGAMIIVMGMSAYPAYADGLSASLQGAIDDLVEVRNAYLAELSFGDSYPTPETAAMETVRSAIELYELTKTHQVSVGDQEYFVRHTNPYGPGEVAFDVINSMRSDAAVYPFVLDADTLMVVAEGAFPGTVGLPAVFLSDADRPLEDILGDLHQSDGAWANYIFNDPRTGGYESKHSWLSLHDGYIFGAGYYGLPDDDAVDNVEFMVRMYDADGEGSFADIPAGSGVSFVLDAETLEIVTHTAGLSGDDVREAIGSNWPLGSVSDVLDRHGSLWLSYPAPDSRPGSEYTRAHLQLHDGYVFASGYGVAPESRIRSLVDEAVRLYDLEGEGAFTIITSMVGTSMLVMDAGSSTILALAGVPEGVGRTANNIFGLEQETVLSYLDEQPGLWSDSLNIDPLTGGELRRSSWMVAHDGYLFSSGHIYSPEAVTVGTVNEAIALYKTHGEEAFDRINWQSARPEIIYPFVVDAGTWETIAHGTVPGRVGACCSQAIAASNDLDAIREELEESPGLWVEYTFYNPISERDEYKRVWLSTYDGYTFGSGYYYGKFDLLQNTINETIDLYETKGKEAAFAEINSMMAANLDYPFILELETLTIVAHGQNPGLVGTNFVDKASTSPNLINRIEAALDNTGDTAFALYLLNSQTGNQYVKTTLLQLHDGYVFAAGQPFVIYTE